MKKFLLLTCFVFSLLSCSDQLESNTPSFVGTKDYGYWAADDFNAILNEDGSVRIVAQIRSEVLTLNIASVNPSTYTLGATSSSSAVFEMLNAPIYTTRNNGDGEITITEYNIEEQTFTGTYRFNAVSQDGEITNFTKGIFYRVPVLSVNGVAAVSQLSASVDESDLNAEEVTTDINLGNVEITGMASDGSFIKIVVPENIAVGSYNLNQGSASGTYAIYGFSDGVTSDSQFGTLFITEHDTSLDIIKGSFIFNTLLPNSVSVENGSFRAYY